MFKLNNRISIRNIKKKETCPRTLNRISICNINLFSNKTIEKERNLRKSIFNLKFIPFICYYVITVTCNNRRSQINSDRDDESIFWQNTNQDKESWLLGA